MSAWQIVALGSKVRFLSGGTPRKDEAKYWNGEIPWVGSAEMVQRRINDTELRVTEEGAREGSKLVPANTVLVVVRGMSLAKEFRVAITERELAFNQDLKALKPAADLDPVFLFYYLLSQNSAIRDSASEAAHGTKKLDMPVLEQWPIPLPPLEVQRKIAAILSAYDDLIANNQRRIALLESMAEQIYREWFVRMRFPGHETTPLEKGLPHGWQVRSVSEILTEQKNSIKRSDLSSVERYVGLEHVPRKSIALNDWGNPASVESDKLRFAVGDILFGKIRPYLHKVALANFDGACSTDIIVLRPKFLEAEAFGLFTVFSTTFVDFATTASKGTKMPRADWHYLKCLEIRVPSQALLQRFQKTVDPMLEEVACLLRVNRQLSGQRDALLPRLISGKLEVDHLDIQLPPSMREKVTA